MSMLDLPESAIVENRWLGGLARTIVVLGAFGSGTSGVTQALSILGCHTCPPHFKTNDPRTPNAYEPISLKRIILRDFDERNQQFTGMDRTSVPSILKAWLISEQARSDKPVAVKAPHLCFYVPEIVAVWNPLFILVERSLDDIEKSRLRRRWPSYLGAEGARVAYRTARHALKVLEQEFLTVSYTELTRDSEGTMERIIAWTGLSPAEEARARAVESVSR